MSATIDLEQKPVRAVSEAAVFELRAKLGDRLISPDDASYEHARRVWNVIDQTSGPP